MLGIGRKGVGRRSVQAKLKYFMFAQHMGIFFQNKRIFLGALRIVTMGGVSKM